MGALLKSRQYLSATETGPLGKLEIFPLKKQEASASREVS
jgi:hypothetical protein